VRRRIPEVEEVAEEVAEAEVKAAEVVQVGVSVVAAAVDSGRALSAS
jgi:hypothetical protein